MAALRHGLPVVSLPAAAIDNQRNAARLHALGAGLAIPSPSRTPDTIAAAVGAMLSDDRYRSRAEAVATSIRSLPSTEDVVDLLERLAIERTPQVRAK
jgi:UDP:flavonoid glycosyltransferase YjiC (YdhE family)